MVTCLLTAAVLATVGVLGWRSRQALLAETEAQRQVIARLLARSAAFGSRVMSDVEDAIGEQMVVEATIAAHLVAVAEAAGLAPIEEFLLGLAGGQTRQVSGPTGLFQGTETSHNLILFLRQSHGNGNLVAFFLFHGSVPFWRISDTILRADWTHSGLNVPRRAIRPKSPNSFSSGIRPCA